MDSELIKISHPDVEGYGYVYEESLEVWTDLDWSVVEESDEEGAAAEEVPTFTVHVGEDGEETMVEVEDDRETPLPDEKESEQEVTEDPEES